MTFLSVIIPTRNRSYLLDGALESLTKQSHPQISYEVIVIDNGSTDNTKEVVLSYSNRIHSLLYFNEPKPGLHHGRHLGMRMARSDILVYADDDIEAFPSWLSAIAWSFNNPDVVLVGGKNVPKFESPPPSWLLKMWEKDRQGRRILAYLSLIELGSENIEIDPYYVFGCNYSIRKTILQQAGGFHPDAMPSDLIRYRGDGETHVSDFVRTNGLKAVYNPFAAIRHVIPTTRMTSEYFAQRAYNEGVSCSFTDYRRWWVAHGHTLGYFSDDPIWQVPKSFSYERIRWCVQTKSSQLRSIFSRDRELARKYSELERSWRQGWCYHRNELKHSSELRRYVLRKDYQD